MGGDLSPTRLISAYQRGIFPWYEGGQPILWWTPDPRSVLFPSDFHCSRSLRKVLSRNSFTLSVDCAFREVMLQCAETRSNSDGPGTWISTEMMAAYSQLHDDGVCHSVEVHNCAGELVGGLYGLALGRAYFGESMFSLENNASKVALAGLIHILQRGQFALIDCQVESEHLNSLGAHNISRLDFEALLAQTVGMETDPDIWRLPANSGDLL